MSFCRLVESRSDNFRLDASLHVGHLLRALVDEQDDLVDLRMVVGDGIGNALEQHGLTCLRLGDDQSSLAFADRSEHVYNPAGNVIVVTIAEKIELLIREEGSEEIERNPVTDEIRGASVDVLDPDEREILVTLLRRTDFSGHCVARFEGIELYLVLTYIDVVRRIQIIVIGRTEESETVWHYLENAGSLDSTFKLILRSLLSLVVPVVLSEFVLPVPEIVVIVGI